MDAGRRARLLSHLQGSMFMPSGFFRDSVHHVVFFFPIEILFILYFYVYYESYRRLMIISKHALVCHNIECILCITSEIMWEYRAKMMNMSLHYASPLFHSSRPSVYSSRPLPSHPIPSAFLLPTPLSHPKIRSSPASTAKVAKSLKIFIKIRIPRDFTSNLTREKTRRMRRRHGFSIS